MSRKVIVGAVKASTLMTNANQQIINAIIQDNIYRIDARISIANQSGMCFVEYPLPTTLSINNMEKSDIQTIVYSELIKIYTKPENKGGKGFSDVCLKVISSDRIILRIQWNNGMTEDNRRERKKLIALYTKQ